jgi:hypothetical protein
MPVSLNRRVCSSNMKGQGKRSNCPLDSTGIVSAWFISVVTDVKVVDGPGLLSTESGNK